MNTKIISLEDYQAILFDFDGVLAESMNVKTEAFTQLFQPFGKDIVENVVKHHITHGGISRYKKIQYYYEEYLKQSISEEKLNEIAQKFSDLVVDKVISSPWVQGVQEFLENHYKTSDFYVVSGTPQEELDLVIQKRHMEEYFKGVYGTPETKPVLIHNIIVNNKYRQDAVLYIGDSYSDYQAAQQAHVPFLGRVPRNSESLFPENVSIIVDFNDVLK